jgi:hypothetical protein
MNTPMQQAPGEPAALPANQLAVETTSGNAAFHMPTGFPRGRMCPAKNPRAEHHQAQRQRAEEALRMAEKYPQLKTLKVALEFVNREGMTKTTEMKYSANPEHAKSVLVFGCPNSACWGGDFDLTAKLSEAVTKRRTEFSGEMHCLGRHKDGSGQVVPCRSLLRYTLNLVYSGRQMRLPEIATGSPA